jgi:hypothetical protein
MRQHPPSELSAASTPSWQGPLGARGIAILFHGGWNELLPALKTDGLNESSRKSKSSAKHLIRCLALYIVDG